MRSIAEAGQKGGSLTADFFREEYELDYRLATMGVPHVALMDGITMGQSVPRGSVDAHLVSPGVGGGQAGVWVSLCTAASVWPLSALCSPCPRRQSGSSPTWVVATSCRGWTENSARSLR